MSFKHILVPVAGNPVDEEAIRLAIQIAKPDKAKVLAIHVIEIQRAMPVNADNLQQVTRGESILESVDKIAHAAKGEIEIELLQARTAGTALVNEALERQVDLIIVGVPYRKPLGDFILGSTTNYILRNAACRVWLCRELPREDQTR